MSWSERWIPTLESHLSRHREGSHPRHRTFLLSVSLLWWHCRLDSWHTPLLFHQIDFRLIVVNSRSIFILCTTFKWPFLGLTLVPNSSDACFYDFLGKIEKILFFLLFPSPAHHKQQLSYLWTSTKRSSVHKSESAMQIDFEIKAVSLCVVLWLVYVLCVCYVHWKN